jgi:hypothetical protein
MDVLIKSLSINIVHDNDILADLVALDLIATRLYFIVFGEE